MRRFVMAVVAVGTLVAAVAGIAVAQAKNATLTLSDGSVAAGVGFNILNFIVIATLFFRRRYTLSAIPA